jgi:hypothetical protein
VIRPAFAWRSLFSEIPITEIEKGAAAGDPAVPRTGTLGIAGMKGK